MKFLVDAQLPQRLSRWLNDRGYDSIHTSKLPEGNRTPDRQIATTADEDDRIIVTKDRDFRDGHLLYGTPVRLLIVATGNISNDELLNRFDENLQTILEAFAAADFVELRPNQLIIRSRK